MIFLCELNIAQLIHKHIVSQNMKHFFPLFIWHASTTNSFLKGRLKKAQKIITENALNIVFQEVENISSLFRYKFKYFKLNFYRYSTSRKMKNLGPTHMDIYEDLIYIIEFT